MATAKSEPVNATYVDAFLETGRSFLVRRFSYVTFIIRCANLDTSCERGFTRLDVITAESELNTNGASLHVNSAHIFKLLSLYRRMRVRNRIEHGGVERERDIMQRVRTL